MEIPVDRHLFILNSKMITWQNTYVDAGDDLQIAQHIGNERLEQEATTRMKQALQAIRWIEAKMTELGASIDKVANP